MTELLGTAGQESANGKEGSVSDIIRIALMLIGSPIVALFVERQLVPDFYHYPVGYTDFVVRIVSCVCGAAAGQFFRPKSRYLLPLLSLFVFYCVLDLSRIPDPLFIDYMPSPIGVFLLQPAVRTAMFSIGTIIGSALGSFGGIKIQKFTSRFWRLGKVIG